MINDPLVSVIVPVWNGARFLREAFESIAAQTYANVEIVVVDDASSDDSSRIAAAFATTLIRHETQLGVAAARNTAVRAASGEILTFLDQDDVWMAPDISVHVVALTGNPGVISIVTEELFLAEGAEKPAWLRPELLAAPHPAFVPSGMAFTRSTFERVGEFDTRLVHGSDTEWFARARSAAIPFNVSPQLTLRRRVHESNASRDSLISVELGQTLHALIGRKRRQGDPR
jgi:glycosyltransferase involved in cell wall biosynthesis